MLQSLDHPHCVIKKFKFEQEGILKDYYHDSDNKRYDAAIFSLVQKG